MTVKAVKIEEILDAVFKNENESDFYHKEKFTKKEHDKETVVLEARISREDAKIILEKMPPEDIEMNHEMALKNDLGLLSYIILTSHIYGMHLPEKEDNIRTQSDNDDDLSDTKSVDCNLPSDEEIKKGYLDFFGEDEKSLVKDSFDEEDSIVSREEHNSVISKQKEDQVLLNEEDNSIASEEKEKPVVSKEEDDIWPSDEDSVGPNQNPKPIISSSTDLLTNQVAGLALKPEPPSYKGNNKQVRRGNKRGKKFNNFGKKAF